MLSPIAGAVHHAEGPTPYALPKREGNHIALIWKRALPIAGAV